MKSITVVALTLGIAAATVPGASTSYYPIKSGCSKFPGYTAGSNVTSPFLLQFTGSSSPVNNNGLVTLNYYDSDLGRLVIPASNDLAKQTFRCNQATNGPNGAPTIEVFLGGSSYTPLQIFAPVSGSDPNAGNAQLVFGAAGNVSQNVVPFSHDPNAAQGIFIGGADRGTEFAAHVEFVSNDVHRSFYGLRYVPRAGGTVKSEYPGLVKVLGT